MINERIFVDDYSDLNDDTFVDQYSQLNTDFTQIQTLIQQYKQSLDGFQKHALSNLKANEQKINNLNDQNEALLDQLEEMQLQKEDLERSNKQLETRNEGLILEIQNLESEKNKLEQKLSTRPQPNQQHHYSHRYATQFQDELPVQVQNQYELLIQRIVKELEYERSVKKKMGEQIKRMSHELMESEREIMDKNKKIYEMEMKILRNSKATADTSINYSKLKPEDNKAIKRDQLSHRSEKDPKANFKSFTLLQLINGQLESVSNIERKIIGMKIVELYERKLDRQDFSSVMPQNLKIRNFSHNRPQILSIQKVGTSAYQNGQKNEESLVWNLAYILDNLLGTVDGVQDFSEIMELTGQVLEGQIENSKESLLSMKQLLQI